ncbi:MAG: hypothetical protein LUD25_02455 [Coriobacteriaceae bacterium]|nr:hypothetical protein [Coriobacteriaceae bacterium]
MAQSKNEPDIQISADELAVAEKEAEAENENVYKHVFEPPFTYEGKTYEELTFDFDSLTGEDDLKIENELARMGRPVVAAEMSGDYLIRMAARCCSEKIGADVFEAMPLREERVIRNKARSFLLRLG